MVEMGSHRELLDLEGVYAELWNGKSAKDLVRTKTLLTRGSPRIIAGGRRREIGDIVLLCTHNSTLLLYKTYNLAIVMKQYSGPSALQTKAQPIRMPTPQIDSALSPRCRFSTFSFLPFFFFSSLSHSHLQSVTHFRCFSILRPIPFLFHPACSSRGKKELDHYLHCPSSDPDRPACALVLFPSLGLSSPPSQCETAVQV